MCLRLMGVGAAIGLFVGFAVTQMLADQLTNGSALHARGEAQRKAELESILEMTCIKSLLVGFAAAAAATIAWSVGEMVFRLPRISYMNIAETGSGGIGAAIDVSYGPFIGIAAFALGFCFMLRRLKLRGISK